MADNKQNNINDEELYSESKFMEIQKRVDNSFNKIKRHIDNVKDAPTCILLLNELKKGYDELIPVMKEVYSKHSSQVVSVNNDNAYRKANELYQYAFKKAESFGISPSEFSQLKLPRSLEKITSPENN
jgi:hypothetical protein